MRLFDLALRVLPAGFRRRYGAGLRETFNHQAASASEGGRFVYRAFVASAILDLVRVAVAEHWGALADTVRQDLRFAWRSLGRNRGVAAVAIVTVSVGIGATTTVFSILNGLLLRPPPILEPNRVVSIWELRSVDAFESMEGRLIDYDRYEAYRDASEAVFDGLAAHSYAHLSVQTPEGASAVEGFLTSGNYFTVLGLAPAVGRLYTEDDEPTVVMSERLWRSRFGADPDIVGRTIAIDSRTFTVGGVVGRGFVGTMSVFTGDLWIPAGAYEELGAAQAPTADLPSRTTRPSLVVPIGRLRDGLDIAQATERVDELARVVRADEDERFRIRGARLDDIRWRSDLAGLGKIGLGTLLGAAAMLLLIACANVAGLTLARSYDRRRELAVRLATGAGRARLIRQMVTENLVLFSLGGAGGLLVGWLASSAVASVQVPLNATVTLDTTATLGVSLAALALALALGVVFGLAPAGRVSRLDLSTALKAGGYLGPPSRARGAFVVGQVGIATLLLIVAGLATRSFLRVLDTDLGFDPEGVLVATLDLESHGYDAARGRAFYDELITRTRAIPGVEGASLAEFVMLGGAAASNGARALDVPDAPSLSVYRNDVDAAFAAVNRVRVLRGRFITAEDREDSQPVVVINETLAEDMWPGRDPVGRRLMRGTREYEVVGVVANGTYSFAYEQPKRFGYYALAQAYRPAMSLHIRALDPLAVVPPLRAVVRELDPDIALQGVRTMTEVVASNRFLPRFLAGLTATFALVGLLLAALGIYGLLSVHVAQRKREFGIRMALGARPAAILSRVTVQAGRLALVGCVMGVLTGFGVARLMSALLFGIVPFDPVTFTGVPLVLLSVAVLASLRPARTAVRADPRVVLQDV